MAAAVSKILNSNAVEQKKFGLTELVSGLANCVSSQEKVTEYDSSDCDYTPGRFVKLGCLPKD